MKGRFYSSHSKVWLLLVLLTTVMLLATQQAYAANCQAANDGDWSDSNSWINCDGGIPNSGDTVWIPGGINVTLDVNTNPDIVSITVDGTLSNGGGTVETTGLFTLSSSGTFESPVSINSGIATTYGAFNGPITIASGATLQVANDSTLTANDDVSVAGTLSGGNAISEFQANGANFITGGGATIDVATFRFSGSSFDSTGATFGVTDFIVHSPVTNLLLGADLDNVNLYLHGQCNAQTVTMGSDLTLNGGQLEVGDGCNAITLDLNAYKLVLSGANATLANNGVIDDTNGGSAVETNNIVAISQNGSSINPPFAVVNGTTTANGTFNGSLSIASGATLQVTNDNTLTANNDVTINGTLSGGNAGSSLHFYGDNFSTAIGSTVSVPHFYVYGLMPIMAFNGGLNNVSMYLHGQCVAQSVQIDSMTFTSGYLEVGDGCDSTTLNLSSLISLADLAINNGSVVNAGDILNISGDWTNSGTFSANTSTVTFNGSGVQNVTFYSSVLFNNLVVASGAILVETETANNASFFGTLTNNGIIRKSLPVSPFNNYTFGLTEVEMYINSGSGSIEVDRIDSNHPNATGLAIGIATGRYWSITGSGFNVDMTLPHNLGDHTVAKVCKYPGGLGGAGWDCDRDASTATTVMRESITSFSDWAVGDNVGPTAVSLQQIQAQSGVGTGVTAVFLLAALCLVFTAAVVMRPTRQTRKVRSID